MININLSGAMPALIGGLVIGLASTIHLLLKGRITGMSGIFNGIITFDTETFSWKSSILSGLLLTSSVAYLLYGFNEVTNNVYLFDTPQSFNTGADTIFLILAGLLVGFGTKLGNGCTSGHGVCGLPRFSLRSLVAVLTFMGTGVLMANTKYYFFPTQQEAPKVQFDPHVSVYAAIGISLLILLVNFIRNNKGIQGIIDIVVSFIVGAIFSLGLLISGMSRRSKVLGFLTFNNAWDISLMFVMGGAVLLNLITFNYIIHIQKKPILAERLLVPKVAKVDLKLVIGAALFGLGWGLQGICPGPSMIVTPIYLPTMIQFIGSMAAGQYAAMLFERQVNKVKTA